MNTTQLVAATDFWSTPIGSWAQAILAAAGIIIVIFAVLKSVGKFLNGKTGEGVKIIVLGLVVAAICVKPDLITELINTVGGILQKGSDSVNQIGSGTGVGTGAAQ